MDYLCAECNEPIDPDQVRELKKNETKKERKEALYYHMMCWAYLRAREAK